jgi:spermidine synthase
MAVALLIVGAGWALLALDSLRTRVLFEGESIFGPVRVVERGDGLRSLYMGAGTVPQSSLHPGRPLHLEYGYTRLAMIGLALVPSEGRMLFVGLGGGSMPMYARAVRPGARLEAVEIDPLVVELAPRYFGFRSDSLLRVHVGDGRAFIERAPPQAWDVIFLDAFSDDAIPFSLTTRQFLEAVRAALSPGGIVVANLWGSNPAYAAMLATYDAVFDDVRLLRVPGGSQRILLAGSSGTALDRRVLMSAVRALAIEVELGFDLAAMVDRGYEAHRPSGLPPLEDLPCASSDGC